MQKICPYCGRKGDLGTPCKGCGYVLSTTDREITDNTEASGITNIFITLTSKRESSRPGGFLSGFKPALDMNNPIHMDGMEICGLVLGSVLLIYGIYGMFVAIHFYLTGDVLNGIAAVLLTATMTLSGLDCLFSPKTYL